MGVDFVIENAAKFHISGVINDWRGTTEYDEEIDGNDLRSLLEDPPDAIDLHIRSIAPGALPEDVSSLHVGMPYSAFNRLRHKIAAAVGIDLDFMWGFMPNPIRIAEMRGLPKTAAAHAPNYDAWQEEQAAWWRERARQWDSIDSGLVPFLNHSDCEDDLSPKECRRIAPALAEALDKMEDDGDTERGRRLLEMIEAAAEHERKLLFR